MDPEKNLATIRKAVEFLNQRDLPALLGLFDEGVLRHDLANAWGDFAGTGGAQEFLLALQRGAPDLRIVLHDAFASGDKAASRVTIEGTHQADLAGRPPTGKRFSVNQLTMYRFSDDGKVVESWQLPDVAGFDAQIRG